MRSCESHLRPERRILAKQQLTLPGVPPGTEVAQLTANITSLTDPARVEALASLTSDESSYIENLRSRLADLQSQDHDKLAQALEFRAERVRRLLARLHDVASVSSSDFGRKLFECRNRLDEAGHTLREHRASALFDQPLENTGSEAWRKLWNAATVFSERDAYPDRSFPVTEHGSRCVLCQQELTSEGAQRFQRFRKFLESNRKDEYDRAAAAYGDAVNSLKRGIETARSASEMVSDVDYDDSTTGRQVREWLDASIRRLRGWEQTLSSGLPSKTRLESPMPLINAVEDHASSLDDRAKELRSGDQRSTVNRLQKQLREMNGREVLALHLDDVLEHIERRKRLAAYQECIADTRTNAITPKKH